MDRGACGRALAVTTALVAAMALPAIATAGETLIPATVTSHNAVVTGEVWVTFGRTGYTDATFSGTATSVATGAVATLYAEPFPFTGTPVAVQTVPLTVTGTSAPFSFTVTPELETRYHVEVFASSTSTTPETWSASLPVFVTSWSSASNAETCGVSACTIHINQVSILPKSTIPVEKTKHQFVYLDVARWNGGPQPSPTAFHLVPASVSAPTVSGDHVRLRITITYPRPASRLWWWFWESCTRDTVARDGLGLAGPHGCGKPTLSPHAPYLG
jgi:hypothetical protein